MKKIGTFFSLLCIVNLLTIAGLVGFLVATGRLDKAKAQVVGDILRHQGTPEDLRVKVYDIMSKEAATQPATGSAPAAHGAAAGVAAGEVPGNAEARIDYVKKVLEQERLTLENEKQYLREQHKLLDQRQEMLAAAEAAFAEEKKTQEARLATASTGIDSGGFRKSLDLLDELKPKQVKDLLMAMPPDDVARYLTAMESDRAAKIMAEFKTADEKTLLNTVLDKVRGANKGSGTGAASGSGAGALSAASPGKAGL